MGRYAVVAALAVLLVLPACGGGGGGGVQGPVVNTPVEPAAAITAAGAGALVVHPSIISTWCCALETPIRITETAGGTADWGFARMQFFLGGREVERTELTATAINQAGHGRINARESSVKTVVFRANADNFDRIVLTLGFNDRKDGRAFTVDVPFTTFSDVTLSFTPLSVVRDPNPL